MERAAAEWRYDQRHKARPYHDGTFPDDLDEWSAERTKETPYHARDGVTFWVASTDVAPHDHWLGGAADCPMCNPESVVDVDEQPDEPEEA